MFVSVSNLTNNMGVDEKIARFFVDRKVPQDNIFWNKRLLYIARGNGYISIPVYYDFLLRIGLLRECLLDESHIQFMEKVMHYAMLVEYNQMSFGDQLLSIQHLLTNRIRNQEFYLELIHYLEQPVLRPIGKLGMPIPSLNRADVFLFILCDLPMSQSQIEQAISYWYALHTSYLIMDDMYDYQLDKQVKDENAIIELGDGEKGFERAFEILKRNIKTIEPVNPTLAAHFEVTMEGLYDTNTKS
ncbi:MAG: hypothetical protein C5B59_10420 [Bacteroidetes bacterium]|nr:MAG: hypothetical protein C5B59_10420 [Bacteroidota bacterium]